MADFNRSNNFNRGGNSGGFKKRDFSDRSSRKPIELHKATCDKCGNACEVPFRPTSGKPVFCRNCFVKPDAAQGARPDAGNWNPKRSNTEDREMFDAVCDTCGKNCKIPFRPTSGRPVYCSNCFEKGNNTPRNNDQRETSAPRAIEQPQYKEQFQAVNAKLDKILTLLTPVVVSEKVPAEKKVDALVEAITEEVPVPKKKKKSSKKSDLTVSE